MDPLKSRYISDVFVALVSGEPDKLRLGMDRRQQMYEQVQRGETPTGARVEWIRTSARRLVNELERIAQDFNETYPDDKCSAQDLLDVLATANAWFKKASSK